MNTKLQIYKRIGIFSALSLKIKKDYLFQREKFE